MYLSLHQQSVATHAPRQSTAKGLLVRCWHVADSGMLLCGAALNRGNSLETYVQLSTSLASCSRLCSSMPLKASHLQGGLEASHKINNFVSHVQHSTSQCCNKLTLEQTET